MVELVLGQGGSLKAEHGTGRMMAPYVRRQYGDELYEVMREIKRLCDPAGHAQPRRADHRRRRRPHPAPQGHADRRVGGRPVRGMRLLRTGLPQQGPDHDAAAADRAAPGDAAGRIAGDTALLGQLEQEYEYDAIDTCAVDGMCQTACPVLINTGDLMKRLRADNAGKLAAKGWKTAAKHWAGTTRAASLALTVAGKLPARAGDRAEPPGPQGDRPRHAAAVVGGAAGRRQAPSRRGRATTCRTSCGATSQHRPTGSAGRRRRVLHRVRRAPCSAPARRARECGNPSSRSVDGPDVTLAYPADLPDLCCGTPWRSKGMKAGYAEMAKRVLPALWAASGQGELPIVCDAASCTEGLRQMLESRDRRPGKRLRRAADRRRRRLRRRARAAQAHADPQDPVDGTASDLFVHPDGDERFAARSCGGGRRIRHGPGHLGLLRVRRRPRIAASGADRVGDQSASGRDCRRVRSMPSRRATAPASWA